MTRGGGVAYDALLQSREAGGSWVLALAMPRHSQETLQAVRVARGAGLKVALVTDLALGPLADEADITFATGTGSRLVFDSYAAAGVLAAALLQAMTDAPIRSAPRPGWRSTNSSPSSTSSSSRTDPWPPSRTMPRPGRPILPPAPGIREDLAVSHPWTGMIHRISRMNVFSCVLQTSRYI